MKTKGNLTKENILKAAFDFAGEFGLEALSIGKLAESVGLSKSGLFGHFKSKEKLQCMVMDYAAANYVRKVVQPVLARESGLPRVYGIIDEWINWVDDELAAGCPLLAAAIEFDDRPGEVQNKVRQLYQQKIDFIAGAIERAISRGDLKAELVASNCAYELYSLMMGYHLYKRLLKDPKARERFETSARALIENWRS